MPGLYTGLNWNKMDTKWKVISIALDVVSLIPFATAATAGARTVAEGTRVARLMGALKGIEYATLDTVRAPVNMVLHPIETAKGTVRQFRNIAEVFASKGRIPMATVGVTDSTVRLLVRDTTSPEEALAIRREIMDEAIRTGKPVYVEVGDQRVELNRSPIMKELKGGAVHAGPSSVPFKEPLEVLPKVGKPQSEQGLFVSHEPLPRFAESAAFPSTSGSVRDLLRTGNYTVKGLSTELGIDVKEIQTAVDGLESAKEITKGTDGFYSIVKGNTPVIYIMSPETASKTIDTAKIYKAPEGAVVEMERKLPIGEKTTGPAQILWTRIGPEGTKTAIYLEKPLSTAQIAKLKAMGVVEMIKTPFKPAIIIEGKGGMTTLSERQLGEIEKILQDSRNTAEARNLGRARALLREGRVARVPLNVKTYRQAIRREVTQGRKVPPSLERVAGVDSRNPEVAARVERIIPERAPAAARGTPARVEVIRTTPVRETPARATPERATPERATTERERAAPGRDERGRFTPARTPVERATVERARAERAPERVTPERGTAREDITRTRETRVTERTAAERAQLVRGEPRLEQVRNMPRGETPRGVTRGMPERGRGETPARKPPTERERLTGRGRVGRDGGRGVGRGETPIHKKRGQEGEEKKELTPAEAKAAEAFTMGALKRGNRLEPVTIAHLETGEKQYYVGKTPEGMRPVSLKELSAKRTVQLIRGNKLLAPIQSRQGFAHYSLDRVTKRPGAPGAIKFGGTRMQSPHVVPMHRVRRGKGFTRRSDR